jgi:chromosomal replication initiator protein
MNKTAQSVWKTVSFFKRQHSDQAFKTWFEPIKSVELTDNALYIQVPSKFFYEWLEEHYVNY